MRSSSNSQRGAILNANENFNFDKPVAEKKISGDEKALNNIRVACRCRPINQQEKDSNEGLVVTCDPENNIIKVLYGPPGKKTQRSFHFDKVFGMYSKQQEVFDSLISPVVDEVLAGFNCTVFAYGQTGTGKTHTMEGNVGSADDEGIVPRATKAMFSKLDKLGMDYTIRVSFLEICEYVSFRFTTERIAFFLLSIKLQNIDML